MAPVGPDDAMVAEAQVRTDGAGWPPSFDRFAVLDIECSPDPAINQKGRKTSASRKLGLKLDGFCLLSGRHEKPTTSHLVLHSRFCEDERALLDALSRLLARQQAGGLLVTYNGRAYDMPILRRRAIRHLLFDLPCLHGPDGVPHLDLIGELGSGSTQPLGSLAQRCAVYSIDCDPYHFSVEPEPMRRSERKCQVDVVATYMLLLHELASQHRSPDVLAEGWDALETMIAERKGRSDHLRQFLP